MSPLTRAHIEDFGKNGFVMIRSAIPHEILASALNAVEGVIDESRPRPEIRGPHNYFLELEQFPPLRALLTEGPVWECAEQLTGSGSLEMPRDVQLALNVPPFPHRPGMPHIDGWPLDENGRPGTFTLLVGVLMSEQRNDDEGNLWVWPGTHRLHADYFRDHGPESFLDARGYAPVELPEPLQIRGDCGDVILAHYLLGHNIGGNVSSTVRRAAYFRVKATGHDQRWRKILQDPFVEYEHVRHVLK
jgi:hypothetical protein